MATIPHFPYKANNGKKPKVLLFGGFPDDETSSWGTTVPEQLSKTYDIFFLCLPGYQKGGKVEDWGHNFDEIVSMMHYTVQKIYGENQPATLIAHDWGSVISLIYQTKYPENVSKLVLLDVGMVDPLNVSVITMLYLTIYQVWFAVAFIMFKLFGRSVGNLVMGLFFLPIFSPIWPCSDPSPVARGEITVDKTYTYYQLWKSLLSGKIPVQKFPKCPVLFLYGKQKNCMFHDSKFMKKIEAREDCKAKEIDAGHWLQVVKADEALSEILPFLSKK